MQATYEVPLNPDLVVYGHGEKIEAAAERVITELLELSYVETGTRAKRLLRRVSAVPETFEAK